MLKKNPLIVFGIIGIVIGFVLQTLLKNNTMLTYGLIGGLAVGFFFDSKNRSTYTNGAEDKNSGKSVIDMISSTVTGKPAESDPAATTVTSGESNDSVTEASDVIARAREEIAKNSAPKQE